MSRTQVWRGHDQLRSRSAALDEALAATGAQVSARWPAIEAWLDHHGDEQPWAVTVEENGQWTAVAVLSARQRHGIKYVQSATEPGTPAALTARDETSGRSLAEALTSELSTVHRPWVLRLGLLSELDPAAGTLREQLRHTQLQPAPDVPRLVFAPGSDVRNYISRNTRSAVARARNRLLREGGGQLELNWLTGPVQARAVLDEVLDVHRRRNQQIRGTAALDDPQAARYFEDMVIGHAESGRLELLAARVNGALAAFAVCFSGGPTCWVYANLVAPEWTGFSVGTIANAEVVRRFHAEPGIDCLDWGAGVQRYKVSGGAVVVKTHVLEGWSSWPLRAGIQLRRLQPSEATP